MKNYVKTLRLMLLMLVGVSGYALADDTTGLVRGKVIGSGDTVEMESVDRGITYGAQVIGGNFNVRSLPPGDYTVVLRDEGQIVDEQTITVALGSATVVTLGNSIEEVVVQGTRVSAVDTAIAESGMVITTEELNQLPVGRSLNQVTLLAPGVIRGDNAFGSNTSFAGSSVAENTSYINGLNTTNFRNGLGFSVVPFEFYESIQVKTGGYSAKYGRSTGGVINSITKSGSNEFKFGVNAYMYGLGDREKHIRVIQRQRRLEGSNLRYLGFRRTLAR